MSKRSRKLVAGVGWVKPKKGYCWTAKGDRIRSTKIPVWGSRKYGEESIGESNYL
jgi:hypothetical protein